MTVTCLLKYLFCIRGPMLRLLLRIPRTPRNVPEDILDTLTNKNTIQNETAQMEFLFFRIRRNGHLLDAKGHQGDPHYQQVQQVEVVAAKSPLVEECSVCGHLRSGWRGLLLSSQTQGSDQQHMSITSPTPANSLIHTYTHTHRNPLTYYPSE